MSGKRWCAHAEIKDYVHATTRKCKHYTRRAEIPREKCCGSCVYMAVKVEKETEIVP